MSEFSDSVDDSELRSERDFFTAVHDQVFPGRPEALGASFQLRALACWDDFDELSGVISDLVDYGHNSGRRPLQEMPF